MTRLPRSLAHWAPYLDLFPREVALALAPLAARVALAVGPLAGRSPLEGGEPDGIDGLARRGPYERLALSELALADEYPDEFVRRAAMGEHLFTRLAERSPAASRVSVALFDAGPNQLGVPRVAHVAALVALARRAEAARASFAWGVLQHVDTALVWDVTPSSVRRMLDLRSGEEATDATVAAWRERLASAPGPDDVWLVGGARLGRRPAARGLSRLDVVDPCDPSSRRLDVTARPKSAAPRAIRLDLPADRECVRLLRDPYEAAVAATGHASGHAPGTNLLFDPSGRKLFARDSLGSVVVYPVPNSPHAGVGKAKFVGPRENVLAVGRAFRKLAFVVVEDGALAITTSGHSSLLPMRGSYATFLLAKPLEPAAALGAVFALSDGPDGQAGAIVFDPAGGRLLRLVPNNEGSLNIVDGRHVVGVAVPEGVDVLAATFRHSQVAFVGHAGHLVDDNRIALRVLRARGVIEPEPEMIPFDDEPDAAFFGYGKGIGRHEYGLVAMRFVGATWRVLTASGYEEIPVPAGSRVVGVAGRPDKSGRPGLLTIAGDGRTIALESRDDRKEIAVASDRIAAFAASAAEATIAYLTEANEVVLWSVEHAAMLARFAPGGRS